MWPFSHKADDTDDQQRWLVHFDFSISMNPKEREKRKSTLNHFDFSETYLFLAFVFREKKDSFKQSR